MQQQQQQQQQSNSLRPSSSGSSTRQSTAASLKPSYHSATSFNPEGFSLQKPSNDQVIEDMFIHLMHKRGWQNLPDQARRQMMAYPPAKKWTLVHQDKLTEWQGEQKRRTTARQTLGYTDGTAILQKADEEGSPEWYVKKILDDSITQKQLQSLAVSLRTQQIG
jgi:cytokinesis protein